MGYMEFFGQSSQSKLHGMTAELFVMSTIILEDCVMSFNIWIVQCKLQASPSMCSGPLTGCGLALLGCWQVSCSLCDKFTSKMMYIPQSWFLQQRQFLEVLCHQRCWSGCSCKWESYIKLGSAFSCQSPVYNYLWMSRANDIVFKTLVNRLENKHGYCHYFRLHGRARKAKDMYQYMYKGGCCCEYNDIFPFFSFI